MNILAADLEIKIRGSDLLIREKLLYSSKDISRKYCETKNRKTLNARKKLISP
jgi:hypothetical protein